MKKHDEGYALVFVLVVMTVLGIVALTLMTGAAKNLTAQADSVSQMQDKYLAQGEIEKIIGMILDKDGQVLANAKDQSGAQREIEKYLLVGDKANGNGITSIREQYQNSSEIKSEDYKLTLQDGNDTLIWLNEDGNSCQLTLKVEKEGGVVIKCTVTLRSIIKHDDQNNYFYFSAPEIVYDSYTIDYTPPAATKGG